MHELAMLKGAPGIATALLNVLSEKKAIRGAVNASLFLEDTTEKLCVLSRALRSVETCLRRAADRRRRYAWYDTFVSGVVEICEINGVRASISTDRITWQRGGRFLEITEKLERVVLPISMRSPNREALAQRVRRSRKRLKTQFTPPDFEPGACSFDWFLTGLEMERADLSEAE
jgi:hypothetical protein